MITESGPDADGQSGCGSCISRRGLLSAAVAMGGAVAAGGLSPAGAVTARWITLGDHGSVAVGQCKRFEQGGDAWLVTRVRPNAYRGFTTICPHVQYQLYPRPRKIVCSSGHGSEFSKFTGEVLHGPATSDLREYRVRVRSGKIQIYA